MDSLSLECCAGVAERQLCCVQQECDFLLHWVPLCAAPLQQMMAALLLQPRAAHIQHTVLLPLQCVLSAIGVDVSVEKRDTVEVRKKE